MTNFNFLSKFNNWLGELSSRMSLVGVSCEASGVRVAREAIEAHRRVSGGQSRSKCAAQVRKANIEHLKAEWLKCAAAIMLVLTIGVGNVWGANQTYTLVSDLSTLTSSDKVLIVSSNGSSNYYALKNNQVSSAANLSETSVTISSNTITADLDADYTWYLEYKDNETIGGSSYRRYYIKSTKGTYYLQNAGDTKSTINTKSTTDLQNVWVIGYQGSYTNKNGTYNTTGLYNRANSRMLAHYSSDWRCYANSNWPNLADRVVQIYKQGSSCDKTVSLTKVASENGSFTLHQGSASGSEIASGGTVDNCGNGTTTVVVVPSPNTNYHVASVTAENSSQVTGPDGSGNYTITYTQGSSISSEITVTFAADPTYTVTWVAGGNSSFHTQTNYAGTALTAPGTPDASTYCPGGKVFVGWTATEIVGETNTTPADLFTSVSGMSIPATNKTYYAVFATATPTNNYKQITTEGALEAGKKYLIVGNSSTTYKALPVDAATDLTAVTPSSSTITTTTAAIIWTLEGSADAWKIKNTSNSKYLQIHGGTLSFVNTTSYTFSVSVSSSKFTFTTSSTATGNKILSYFHNGNCFNAYSSANTIYIYKQQINYTAYATTCSADPMLNVDPTTLNFGNVANGTYKEMTFSLSGTNLAENASIAVSGTNSSYFTVSPSSVNKGSGTISATDITVRYTPGAVGDGHTATVTVTSGEAEAKTVTLTGNSKATYSVSVSPTPSNGTVTSDKTSGIMAGETVTLTITPSSGYQLASINAVDGSSNTVTLSGSGNTRTFTMPASNVTISATFSVRTDYVLVESALADYSGEYLIVCNNSGTSGMYALSGRNGNKNVNTYGTYTNVFDYYDSEAKTIESNSTTDAMKMVIEAGSTPGYYTIKFENDASYLAMLGTNSSTGDKLRFITTPFASGEVYEWSISLISETPRHRISIWNTAATPTRYDLERNGTSGYRLYSYTQQDPELYKKVETCERLAAPTGLSAGSLTQTTATLSWTAVANASGYEVSLDNGSNWTSAGTNTSYSATSLTQGTTYNWKVRATGDGSTHCAKGTAASSSFTTKRAVKVTYNGNGHTSGQYPVTGGKVDLTEGDSYTILGNTGNGGAALAKTGYTFDGWHNSSTYSATPAYTIGNSITVTEDITLYANWKPKKDAFVDAVHNTATQYGEGYNYTIPSCSDQTRHTSGTCEETHYKFIGWALAGADLSNPSNIIHAGDTQTATGTDASPKTYYAVWAEEL